MVHSTYQMEVEWQIWYSQHIRWKWNDRYDTANISDRSRMTDMIHSTYQMEVEWQIWYSQHIRWKWNDIYDTFNISDGSGMTDWLSYLSFHFHLMCWLYHICHSSSNWCVDCIISVIPLPSDWLTVSYLSFHFHMMCWLSYMSFHFHLICWLYYICHSTSIWYVDCIISDIPLPSDMLTELYLSFHFWKKGKKGNKTYLYILDIHNVFILWTLWHIWYSQHIRWKWNDRYDTVNISDGSGMTDMIQSTYQMEV
jgi:hypothetical protein